MTDSTYHFCDHLESGIIQFFNVISWAFGGFWFLQAWMRRRLFQHKSRYHDIIDLTAAAVLTRLDWRRRDEKATHCQREQSFITGMGARATLRSVGLGFSYYFSSNDKHTFFPSLIAIPRHFNRFGTCYSICGNWASSTLIERHMGILIFPTAVTSFLIPRESYDWRTPNPFHPRMTGPSLFV